MADENGIGSALAALEQIGELTADQINGKIAEYQGKIDQLKVLLRIAKTKEPKAKRTRKKAAKAAAE